MVQASKKGTVLFVYGTLLNGFGNHKHLMRNAEFLGAGETHGKLYAVGVGGTFPGAKFGPGGNIKGELYRVSKTELAEIDSLEGHRDGQPHLSLFYRTDVIVKTKGGEIVEAQSYEYQPACDKRLPISSGDFRKYVKEHK